MNKMIIEYHLKSGHILLPPQVFIHMWTECWQTVINVHNYMNKTVNKGKESAVASYINNIKNIISIYLT
jgi:hypothetical protein